MEHLSDQQLRQRARELAHGSEFDWKVQGGVEYVQILKELNRRAQVNDAQEAEYY